jgi:hypothetical protein
MAELVKRFELSARDERREPDAVGVLFTVAG